MILDDVMTKYIEENLLLKTWPALANDLKCTPDSLRKACYKAGFHKHSHNSWSDTQNSFLIEQLSNGKSPNKIAKEIGRSIASINAHITTLGLRDKRETNMSFEEAAYIAGYLEADGCFSFRVEIKNNKPIFIAPVISVGSVNIGVCKWFKEKFGGQVKVKTKYRFEANWSNAHSYCISDKTLVREILQQIKPHLRFKREQAEQLETFCNLYRGTYTKELLELVIANRKLNTDHNNKRAKRNNKIILELIKTAPH